VVFIVYLICFHHINADGDVQVALKDTGKRKKQEKFLNQTLI